MKKTPRILGQATGPARAADIAAGEIGQLLPETRHVLEAIEAAEDMYELDRSGLEEQYQIASYHVQPQADPPPLKFHVISANEHLLALVGKQTQDFEVLQVRCAGLQYHWRSDLVRALEEQVPLIGRLYGIFDRRDLVIEHLTVPIVRKDRIREVWGWFAGDQDLRRIGEAVRSGEITMFRRSERAQPVQLHKGTEQRN